MPDGVRIGADPFFLAVFAETGRQNHCDHNEYQTQNGQSHGADSEYRFIFVRELKQGDFAHIQYREKTGFLQSSIGQGKGKGSQ